MSALVIPCHIRTKWDLACLRRLLARVDSQTLPFDRVYLIDDASPIRHDAPFGFLEHVRLASNGGPARARNVGVERALDSGSEYLLFTDHDCVLDSAWNEKMTGFLRDGAFGTVGGMTYAWGATLLDRYHDLNGTLNGKWLLPDRKELWYMPSLNFGMRAEVAREFTFDERFPTSAGEDVDLSAAGASTASASVLARSFGTTSVTARR
ncbi:glycosyltransferase family 2 protein [Anaeromyxobacter oryzae]|uniref:Glycosyltransferase 2-like domain-containing protein n=1 Tax=Anaeromyxobacter oryzae TaxID=2918170 RepID=A0ABN6MPD4_9BACT|nr:glycosyltransferase [Anaeromyxobacter oryzae]BDG02840.1 hypothetical protein AMOR_18360 [Anaeromyxobacter oryzae]